MPLLTFHAIGLDRSSVSGGFIDIKMHALSWMCPRCYWLSCDIETQGKSGIYVLEIHVPEKPFRITEAHGLPLFFCKPHKRFPYAGIRAQISGDKGRIAGRVCVSASGEYVSVEDIMSNETACIFAVPGTYFVSAGQGIEYQKQEKEIQIGFGETKDLSFSLTRALQPAPGWIWGDQHSHSYFNDGGQSPRINARAGRANGLHYMFLTDNVEASQAGFFDYNEEGVFLGIAGQEVTTPFTHCNALNIMTDLPSVLYGERAEKYPGPAEWLDIIRVERKKGIPCLLQLNHPSHRYEIMSNPKFGYFRSWWVADEYPDDIRVVENFDFPSWFDRISRGRKLTGIWTTDGHDTVYVPPGTMRTALYTGGDLTSEAIIDALMKGRSFSTRWPGALLYLTVNGMMVGDTARPVTGGYLARVRAQSSRPIIRIDIIQDGFVTRSIEGTGALEIDSEIAIDRQKGNWVLAELFAEDEGYPENDHCGNPLDVSGVLAFTNPVYMA